MDQALKGQMAATLAKTGLPNESIYVFGTIRLNIHVLCVSHATSVKWAMLLNLILPGATAKVVQHVWNAAENKGTCLRPTVRKGYLIAIAA